MGTWLEIADRLSTDERLSNLNASQVQAVIDVLCLVIYADNRVSALEEVEFGESLLKMPWLQDKEQIVKSRINTSSSSARYANTPEARQEIANEAAKQLADSNATEAVFSLAASMAYSDLVLHARETQVLDILAIALGLEAGRAEEITNSFS